MEKKGRLWERVRDGVIRCLVCERRCSLKEGGRGVCANYSNQGGKLVHDGYGALSAVESRPIEIKPLFHYWPNSTALTFSGYGCNFYCPWCQNYHLSFSKPSKDFKQITPEELVEKALKAGDEGLCASFNEPTTLYDYILDAFELGRKQNLYGVLVTNGYFTQKAIKLLIEFGADGFSIDIKGCPNAKKALTTIDHSKVIRNAKLILDLGGHVEMVYLVVPDYNDSIECAEWILGKIHDALDPETPIHINRYYPAHKWRKPSTSIRKLLEIKELAERMGLEYVYVGNVGVSEFESTKCPSCGKLLIVRNHYRVTYYRVHEGGCPRCGKKINLRGRYIGGKGLPTF